MFPTTDTVKGKGKIYSEKYYIFYCNSVIFPTADTVPEKGKIYSEKDYTNTKDPKIDSYSKSKALAEKKAWKIHRELPGEL